MVAAADDADAYASDRALARKRRYLFSVATKDGRGMPWKDVQRDIMDLDDAMRLARGLSAFESGVFVRGGFLYWTSAHPELFNSTVLKLNIG